MSRVGVVAVRGGHRAVPLRRFLSLGSLHSTVVVAAQKVLRFVVHISTLALDSNICSIENSAMAALLDLHPDSTDAVLSGVAEICTAVLDRMLAQRLPALVASRPRRRGGGARPRHPPAGGLKLKLVAAADTAGVAKDAGFTGADAWLAKTTTVSRADAARQVALAAELDSGHDATAEALDAGLVSPEHAAVIVHATGQLPDTVSDASSARSSRQRWWRRRPGSAPTSSAASRAGRSRPSNPTRRRGRPRERAHPHRRASRPGEVLTDACTTTATAPPPDTSPSPPWPPRCSARSSTR